MRTAEPESKGTLAKGRWRGLAAHGLQQRGGEIFVFLMVACVEPNRAEAGSLQFTADQIHQRTLPGSPGAVNRQGDGKLCLRIAEKTGDTASDTAEAEVIDIVLSKGTIAHGEQLYASMRWPLR